MLAMLWPLVLSGVIGVLLALTVIVHESLAPNADGVDAAAAQFIAGARAVTAFAEANPGVSGGITAQQLAPFAAPYALPAGFQAEILGGQIFLWSAALPAGVPAVVWKRTGEDCAVAVNRNGTLQSPCGPLGAAPAGVAAGSLVYTISAPQ